MEPETTAKILSNLEKEEESRRGQNIDIKVQYKATVIKHSGTGIRTDTQINGTEYRAQK